MSTLIEKNLSWQFASEVQEICKPIFETLKINYFDYARFYPDNSSIILYSDKDWVKCFLTKFEYVPPSTIIQPGAHLWNEYIPSHIIDYASQYFAHNYGVTFYFKNKHYNEIMNFSAPIENSQILSVYMNHQNLLLKFKDYFIDKASNLINKLESSRLILPIEDQNKNNLSDHISDNDLTKAKLFLVSSQSKDQSESLTSREIECLTFLVKGDTAKMVARKLNISNRTVEGYIVSLKRKLHCRNKGELISTQAQFFLKNEYEYI